MPLTSQPDGPLCVLVFVVVVCLFVCLFSTPTFVFMLASSPPCNLKLLTIKDISVLELEALKNCIHFSVSDLNFYSSQQSSKVMTSQK